MTLSVTLHLGKHEEAVRRRLDVWDRDGFAHRLWTKDPSLWFEDAQPELVDRLGWLTLPYRMREYRSDLESFASQVAGDGVTDAVVLGMGGSSLAPEVFQAVFSNLEDRPRLHVLDSTHPSAVVGLEERIDLDHTLFIVSSKSGTTLETLSFFRYFWSRVAERTRDPGSHFVAVTDPGSSLAELAAGRAFRRVFEAPPDVGGRYSALTEFGLVPAAVIGADLVALGVAARNAADRCGSDVPASENIGIQVGAALGELADMGRDKLTILTSSDLESLPAWIEQLVAESTGKDGRGIVPIGGEAADAGAPYGADRCFLLIELGGDDLDDHAAALEAAGHPMVRMRLGDVADLVGAMFVLEVAIATAGSVLGIHPFNQPDVQVAKELAARAMDGTLETGAVTEWDALDPELSGEVHRWFGNAVHRSYIGLHAYLEPTKATRAMLEEARLAIRDRYGVATTLDFGPRFLHSTGQLHKGGPPTGMFIQIIDHPEPFVAVPETDFDFGKLIGAQALGDHQALQARHRPTLLICLGDSGSKGLEAIRDSFYGIA